MLRNLKKTIPTLMTLTLLAAAAGCAERSASDGQGAAGAGSGDSGLQPNSPGLVYATKDWTELSIDANSAVTKINTAAHFSTDKNRCQKKGDGPFDEATWNALATLLNHLSLATPLSSPRCVDAPSGSKFWNKGDAQLTLAHSVKRQLFEYKNAQICTTIADPKMAADLMDVIEKTIRLADLADDGDCPTPRPQPQ